MSDNYVQRIASGGGSSPQSATLTGVTAGNRLVAFAWYGSGTPGSPAVSDAQGSYTALGSAVGPDANSVWCQIYELKNANSGSHTVSWSWTGGGSGYVMFVEVGTTDTTTASTVNGNMQDAPGTGTDAVTSNSVTISAASTLLAMSTDSSSITTTDAPSAGTGFTSRDTNANSVIGAWRLESIAAASNQAGTFTAVQGADTFHTMAIAVTNGGSSDTLMGQACL